MPRHPIHIDLYVYDLFFFSESDAEEARFKNLLNNQVITDFMGDADFSSAPLPNGSDALTETYLSTSTNRPSPNTLLPDLV